MRNTLTLTCLIKSAMRILMFMVILIFPVCQFGGGNIFAAQSLQQQKKQITGKVTEATSHQPLPGVSVLIKGTTTGTITDMDGNYTIEASPNDVLVFSFVGYLNEEVKVGDQTKIDVTLAEDIIGLDEVVVTGYGVQKKSDLTGAVASVSGDKIAQVPVTGVDQALQGRAAGVSVTSSTGLPGASVNIQIRGISSINGTAPLVIVDGVTGSLDNLNPNDIESVEVLKDAASAAIYGSAGGNGVILVTTKKGKAGKMTTNFNFYRGWQRPWKKMDVMNSQQYAQYQNLIIALRNLDKTPNQQSPPFTTMPDTLKNYDYQDIMFRTALMDNYDFSFSGGNEKSTFYASADLTRQQGVLIHSDYKRMSLRINADHKLSKIIKVGENVTFTNDHRNGYEPWVFQNEYNSPVVDILSMVPYIPPYSTRADSFRYSTKDIYPVFPVVPGKESPGDKKWGYIATATNPLVTADNNVTTHNNYSIGGNFHVDLNLFKGFTFTSRVNAYTNFNLYSQLRKEYHYSSTTLLTPDELEKRMDHQWGWETQNYFNYNRTFAGAYNLLVMAGTEAHFDQSENMHGIRVALPNESPQQQYFDASTIDSLAKEVIQGDGWQQTMYSYFGRVNLDYKSIYLLSFNVRNDYSSRFGPQNRSGVFPSVSGGIKFSDLGFFKNIPFLSFGKIRAGYGVNGANAPQRYAYYPRVQSLGAFRYPLGSGNNPNNGAAMVQVPNPEIHWERMIMTNIGMDLGFFGNKLNVTADWFRKGSDGMLTYLNLPANVGYYQEPSESSQFGGDARPLVNVGKVRNTGLELTVGYRKMEGDFKYSLSFNGTYVKNKVLDLGSQDSIQEGSVGVNLSNVCLTAVGNPMSQFFGLETDGLFKTTDPTEVLPDGSTVITNQPYYVNSLGNKVYAQKKAKPGDFRFKDINGDGKIDDKDRVLLGNPIPKFIMGFSANLSYKGFDMNIFFEGKFGYKLFNGAKSQYMTQQLGQNALSIVLNEYHQQVTGTDGTVYPANTNTNLARLDPKNDNNNFGRVSDYYVEDGSYLRLKNAQLGYTLPDKLTSKVGIQKFRIYVGAKNMLTFTKYTGFDPEFSYTPVNSATGVTDEMQQGIDKAGNYPQSRMYLVGVNLQF